MPSHRKQRADNNRVSRALVDIADHEVFERGSHKSIPGLCARDLSPEGDSGILGFDWDNPGADGIWLWDAVAAAAFPYRLNGSLAKFGMRHVRGQLGREVNFPRGKPKNTVNLHRLFLKWLTQPVASRPWAPCSARPLDVSGWV